MEIVISVICLAMSLGSLIFIICFIIKSKLEDKKRAIVQEKMVYIDTYGIDWELEYQKVH